MLFSHEQLFKISIDKSIFSVWNTFRYDGDVRENTAIIYDNAIGKLIYFWEQFLLFDIM